MLSCMGESVADLIKKLALDASYFERDGDYQSALVNYIQIQGLIASMSPDASKDGIEYRRRAGEVDKHIAMLEKLVLQTNYVTTGVLRRIPVTTGVIDGLERDEWGS